MPAKKKSVTVLASCVVAHPSKGWKAPIRISVDEKVNDPALVAMLKRDYPHLVK